MTHATLNRCFDHRAVIGLLAVGLPSGAALGAAAEKLRLRDVVTVLTHAQEGQYPDL